MTATDETAAAPARDRLEHRIMHAEVARRLFGAQTGVAPTVGRFVVLETVGAGGMGTVYRAYDPELDRKIALKVLEPGARRDRAATLRLRREAVALARLTHPNVVTVHEVGAWGDEVFVAMEYVEGEDLRAWAGRNRDDTPQRRAAALDILLQAGRGLAAAHAAGLVHRDFKPSNVLVGVDGRVRVADFGLARSDDDSGEATVSRTIDGDSTASLTTTGAVMGTPRYMSPEQRRGRGLDARTDQFSFCVTAWEILLGQHPFGGAPVVPEAMRAPKAPAGAPAALVAALARGLEVDPSRRFPSMDDLLAALAPPPRRDRRVLVIGAGAVGLSAAAAALAAHALRSAPCEGAAHRLDGVWDPDRQAQAQQAVLATDLPFAEATWAEVGPALTAYAEQWIAAHEDACAATEIRREQTAEMMDLRVACLAGRRRALDAFVDLLVDADADVVERAAVAARELPPVELCAQPDYVLDGFEPIDDAAREAEAAKVRDALADAQALHVAGKYAREKEVLASVLDTTEALGHPPLSAEVALQQGIHATDATESGSADHLLRAYVLAVDADLDRVAVEAAGRLANLLTRTERDDAKRWLAVAGGRVDDLADPLIVARYEDWKAAIAFFGGAMEEALAGYEAALAALERELGSDDPRLADPLMSAAHCFQNLGRYDEADARLRRALELTERALGPDHPQVAAVLLLLGGQALRLEDNQTAERRFTRALEIRRRSHAHRSALTQPLLGLGMAVRRLGRLEEAIASYRESAEIFDEEGMSMSPDRAYAHDALSEALVAVGHYDEAVQHAEASLALRRALVSDDNPQMGESLFSLARARAHEGRHEVALDLYRRAHKIYAATMGPDSQHTGWALSAMAEMLVELRRFDEAEARAKEHLAALERTVGRGHLATGRPLAVLAGAAEGRGRLDEARDYYEAALAAVTGSNPDEPRAREPLVGLARVLLAQGDARGAKQQAERALALERSEDPARVAEIRDLITRASAAAKRSR